MFLQYFGWFLFIGEGEKSFSTQNTSIYCYVKFGHDDLPLMPQEGLKS